jgi:integrase
MPLDRNTLAVYIGLATGMRRGEVLGLAWANVDLEDAAISVEVSLSSRRKVKNPKTEAGFRKITLDGHTASKLAEWKATQAKLLKQGGIAQTPDTPVCSNRYGEFCQPSRFYRWFQTFCVQHGYAEFVDDEGNVLPKQHLNANGHPVDAEGRCYTRTHKKPKTKKHYQGLKYHELRHTHATLLIANGVDIKTVQNRLGHASAALTLNFYAHPVEERDRAATELFGSLLEQRPDDSQN